MSLRHDGMVMVTWCLPGFIRRREERLIRLNKEQALVLVSRTQNYGSKQFRSSVRMIAATRLAHPSHIKVHPSRVQVELVVYRISVNCAKL